MKRSVHRVIDWLWVLGFDDHARDRYRDPPSPLSRALLAAYAAKNGPDPPPGSRGPEERPKGDESAEPTEGAAL